MLLDNDVVADREAKARPFPRRLGREKWVEDLVFYVWGDSGAIVSNPDLHTIAQTSGRGHKSWFIPINAGLRFSFRCRVKPVRNQVQKDPCNILWKDVGLASLRIKRSLQSNIEALLFGARAVIGEIKAFLDQGIDIDNATFARTFARVQQHVFDDRICPLAVLHDLVEIASQYVRQFIYFDTRLIV